jgi:chorismate mutase-like protein
MVAELTALRDQIDEVDKALLSLLAKRLELVAEVGEVKSQYGLPIYVPERESAMLASRRKEAGSDRGCSASRDAGILFQRKRQRLQNPAAESAAGGHRRRRWADGASV